MGTYTPNLNLYKPDSSDDLSDFRTEFNDNMDKLDNGGGGGGGGHTIVDEDGNDMPQEAALQFTGNVTVTDDNVNGRTVVDILGGGGGNGLIVDAQIYSDTEKVVGIWRDNKPLYQKTLYSATGLSAHMVFSHGITDIDTLAKSECILRADDDSYQIPITTDQANAEFEVTPTDIEIWLNNDFLNLLGNGGYAITLWYTKTTDVAGSGGYEAYGFSPVIYSDVERKIGVWRNNKPLYQKTFLINLTLGTPNTWYSTGINISANNFDEVVKIVQATSDVSAVWSGIGLNIDRSSDVELISFRPSGGINIKYLTLQYTKTTDVAGSGDYNTYGVPTVHYSTSEQVIGTWLDGKPLYQMTVNFGALPNNVSKKVNHNIANVKRIWVYDGYAYNPDSGYVNQLNLSGTSNISTQWYCGCTDTFVEIRPNSDRTQYSECYVTVRYTKSTD